MRRKIGDMYKYGFYWETRVHLGCTSWRVLAVREKTTPSAPYRKIRDAPVQKARESQRAGRRRASFSRAKVIALARARERRRALVKTRAPRKSRARRNCAPPKGGEEQRLKFRL